MIWFLVLILYICLLCAVATPRVREDNRDRGHNLGVRRALPPLTHQNTAEIEAKACGEKTCSDYDWIFELGF